MDILKIFFEFQSIIIFIPTCDFVTLTGELLVLD